MCSILLYVLNTVSEVKGCLPPSLKLQLDNCAKDNKNKTVMGLLASLVQAGVFVDIEVSMYFVLVCSNET